ncbi:MAG: peptidoglycan editing factor PgeF [Tannerellaceae bacterium]|nr:peptidoglycan editing factor PgeF [Tannerellaceae bacterium]
MRMTNTIGTMMKTPDNKHLPILQFSVLKEYSKIVHFMTTRHGGVSRGKYASLNLSEYCGDDPAAVRQNREKLCTALGISPADLYVPHQVHGDRVSLYEASARPAEDADALITGEQGICIAVSTADCVSVLLYAPDKEMVAAIHAGWRGTLSYIVAKTLRRMVDELACDPRRMRAGIGPSIGADVFETGEEVYDAFAAAGMDMRAISKRNKTTGKALIDLKEANRRQLLDSGLTEAHIEVSDVCTYTRPDDFFSARRSGINSGRMLTGIMIKNS